MSERARGGPSEGGLAGSGQVEAGEAFDVCGALPSGTTVLEASAGTGKTSTIAALATRYLAEGVAELPQLLLVTFGRAATSELRERVRDRLVRTSHALAGTDPTADPDDLVRLLATTSAPELDLRRRRLAAAVAGFDAAQISTTHGFCQRALSALGLAADADPAAVLVPDQAELIDEVVDDLYVRRYGEHRGRPEDGEVVPASQARAVARAASGDPSATLVPADADPATVAGHLVAFAATARAELATRKRAARLLDYDDLLVLLRDALADPHSGAAARQRLREQTRVVLVDEFQDTDPVQWDILRLAYHGHLPLVLIGDPKQAIYAFRGGDVAAYLTARGEADHVATLTRNWRAEAGLLRGLGALLRGVALGDPRIVVGEVEAARPRPRVVPGPPVRLRQVTRPALGSSGRRLPPVGRVREVIVADVVDQVTASLQHGRLGGADVDGDTLDRSLCPADLAVLVRRNADALAVREALAAAGVPAVVSGLSSVFASPAAADWMTLLRAVEQSARPEATAALALTPFVGWTVHDVATASDSRRQALDQQVRGWGRILRERGVAALAEAAATDGLAERLLRTAGGERRLTDLRHVAQQLHEACVRGGLGPSALVDWLHRRIEEAAVDYAEERSRRLDSDADAVQVVTVHAAKGLEFPVVFVPFAWDRFEGDAPPVLRLHDTAGQRLLHVGGATAADAAQARQAALAEERGEDLRLLYVALTRACSQVVVWWAPTGNAAAGAATRVLLGQRSTDGVLPDRVAVPADEQAAAQLAAVAARCPEAVAHEQVLLPPAPGPLPLTPAPAPVLELAVLSWGLDPTWRRTSYSSLTAAAHTATYGPAGEGPLVGPEPAGVGSEPEGAVDDDEPATRPDPTLAAAPVQGRRGVEERVVQLPPMADLPGGTGFGTLVHDVLEHVDTGTGDLREELERACLAAGADRLPDVGASRLAEVLQAVMRTPMGPLAADLALADIPTADRLPELEFELPLAGGDVPAAGPSTPDASKRRAARLADVADLLDRHLRADDPLAGYATRLRREPLATARLRGYLTGSIDAVLRLHTPEGPRFVVVDYKTNRLARAQEMLTTEHYRPAPLAAAMIEADYPLQLLLYLVALHRYLRWRLPGYDAGRHLGGGLYLFVRGMCGPDTVRDGDVPAGVFGWRPPGGLVAELSALLEGVPS